MVLPYRYYEVTISAPTGAKLAGVPVGLPTMVGAVHHLKTAKAMDLKIPPSLRLRADEVIE